MLRELVIAGFGLCSIACSGESYSGGTMDARCDWGVLCLVSLDEGAGDCEWSVRSLDTSIATLRSLHGEPSEEVPVCGLATYERLDGLRTQDVVEVWSASGSDPDISWLSVEQGPCR